MSTRFIGEGNIGSDPIVKMFPDNGNQPPRGVMRLNVRFDNLVPTEHGLIDRGGFWANVEVWGRQVEEWSTLYQRSQRVLVIGRMVLDTWEKDGEEQSAFKVQADRVGILPYRVLAVEMDSAASQNGTPPEQRTAAPPANMPPSTDASGYGAADGSGTDGGGMRERV